MSKGAKGSRFIFRALAVGLSALVGIVAIAEGNQRAGFWLLVGAAVIWCSTLGPELYKSASHRLPALLIGLFLIFVVAPIEHEGQAGSAGALSAQDKRQPDTGRAMSRQKDRDQRVALEREKLCNDTTGAFLMSREFVKDNLLAPTAARFPRSNADGVSSVATGGCQFIVRAYIDAQNAFGAMIRSQYEVELLLNPDTERWHALSVNILG